MIAPLPNNWLRVSAFISMFDGFDSFDTYNNGKHKSKWLDLFMGGRVGGHVSGGLS